MSFNTGFIELFKEYGIKYPIVQAPMAGVIDAKVASEVSIAGGLGFLPIGYQSYEDLEKSLKSAHELLQSHINPTNGLLPIGVGFITFALDSQISSNSSTNSHLRLTLSYKPLAIWFSFGDFSKYVPEIRSLSPHTKILAQVQTIGQAINAYENDADVIVVQGNESGGHGLMNGASTLTLVPEAIDTLNQIYSSSKKENLKKPIVLAAGGIIDGRGLAAVLALGGDGVVMGTRFIVCKESSAHPDAKKIIINTNDGGINTVRTQLFDKLREIDWPVQWDGRAIKNKTVEENEGLEENDEKFGEIKRTYKEATQRKDYSRTAIYAGAGVGLIHDEPSIKEILENTTQLALSTIKHVHNSVITK